MNINSSLKQTKYNVSRKVGRAIKYIVIHYTGTQASAANNCKYFGSGDRSASADYFIDVNGAIYLFNGDIKNYYTWHCGDGKGRYGILNANSIGIEVVSAGSEFTLAQKNALRDLVQMLMKEYNISNVVRHYDASRKICPSPYCGSKTKDKLWAELKNYILAVQAEASPDSSTLTSYLVKINTETLNVRKGPGTSYAIACTVKMNDVYTIIDEYNGWGKLKSGAGWIYLKYTVRV